MDKIEVAGSFLEAELVEMGYKNLSLTDKNNLISMLATRNSVPFTEITESYVLNHTKTLKKQMLSVQCEEEVLKGFVSSNGHTYRTNRDDQMNLMAQKDYLNTHPEEAEVMWKTVDAGYVKHTREEWLKVYEEGFQDKKKKLFLYDTLCHKVDTAVTDEELVLITWEAGMEELSKPAEPEVPVEEIPTEPPVEETPTEETPVEDTTPSEEPVGGTDGTTEPEAGTEDTVN